MKFSYHSKKSSGKQRFTCSHYWYNEKLLKNYCKVCLLSFRLLCLFFVFYTNIQHSLSPKMFLNTKPDYPGNKSWSLIKPKVHISVPNKYFVALNLVPCRGQLAPSPSLSNCVFDGEKSHSSVNLIKVSLVRCLYIKRVLQMSEMAIDAPLYFPGFSVSSNKTYISG